MNRRSRKDYPAGVLGIYDNHGQRNASDDRYTVALSPEEYYGRKYYSTLYITVDGQWSSSELPFRVTGGWQSGPNSAGKTISWAELPAAAQAAVNAWLQLG